MVQGPTQFQWQRKDTRDTRGTRGSGGPDRSGPVWTGLDRSGALLLWDHRLVCRPPELTLLNLCLRVT